MSAAILHLKRSLAQVHWLGITRVVMLQTIIICVLSVAAIRYVDWSSEAARAEFAGASAQTASVAARHAPCLDN